MAGRSIDPSRPPTDDDSAKPARDAFGDPVPTQRGSVRRALDAFEDAWRTSDAADKRVALFYLLIGIAFILAGALLPRGDAPLWFLIPWCVFAAYIGGSNAWRTLAGRLPDPRDDDRPPRSPDA